MAQQCAGTVPVTAWPYVGRCPEEGTVTFDGRPYCRKHEAEEKLIMNLPDEPEVEPEEIDRRADAYERQYDGP